jgi:hypothetical protein
MRARFFQAGRIKAMNEALYRHQQAVRRLFGPSARLTGSAGSGRGPGVLEIKVDGRTIGSGSSFGQALQAVTTRRGSTLGRAPR